ncbi:MAG: hypothetical protein ABI855_18285, partial [Bacteroidota bacterium]
MASLLDINDMRELAQMRGGKCLSREYIDQHSPLKWMCEKGHTWDSGYAIVRQGGWCVACTGNKTRKLTIEDAQQNALERGGKCLTGAYINALSPLKFQCSEGHQWVTSLKVVRKGSWCPQCAHPPKVA